MNDDSEQNGLGEFHLFNSLPISHIAFTVGEGSPPPRDSPNDPPGTSNGGYATFFYVLRPWCLYMIIPILQVDDRLRVPFDDGGSPPPPPPPSGTGVDDENSGPTLGPHHLPSVRLPCWYSRHTFSASAHWTTGRRRSLNHLSKISRAHRVM
jgi:hypothetical protein